MRKAISAWISGLIAVVGIVGLRAQTAPLNDDFAQAITVPSGPGLVVVTGNLAHATREPGEPYNPNGVASVWYKWTPAISGYFRLVPPQGISVWIFRAAESVSGLTILGGDGDKPWLDQGTTYYLGAYGPLDRPAPTFEFQIDTVVIRPENDDIVNAKELFEAEGKVLVRGTGAGATYESGEPFNTNGLASVWFKWTPNASGRVRFLSERPLPNIWFFFYAPAFERPGIPFSGMANTAREGQSPFLAVGITYYIAVYPSRQDAGPFEFAIELVSTPDGPRPPNDDFANAIELQEEDGYVFVRGTNLGSTFERNEPYYGNSFGAVWYKWTPSARVLEATVHIGWRGGRMFSGTALENLKLVNGWSDSIVPGQTYFIAVNDGGTIGTAFDWAIQVATPLVSVVRPPNDNFAKAFELREASGDFIVSLDGATTEPGEPRMDGCKPSLQRTAWYRFTPPVDGVFHIGSEFSLAAPAVDLFTGPSVDALVAVRAEETVNNGQKFSMTGGQTYHIRGKFCAAYSFPLDYAFLPVELNGGVAMAKRLSQTITFEPLRNLILGAPPFWLQANANSGLPVTFSVVAGPATLSGSLLTVTGGGFVTIAATQEGNEVYESAPEVRQTFYVEPLPQVLTFDPVDVAALPIQLHARSSAGLPVTFQVISGSATILDGVVIDSTGGPLTVRATQPGNDNYQPALPMTRTFVAKRLSQVVDFPFIGDVQLAGDDAQITNGILSALTVAAKNVHPSVKTVSVTAVASSGLPVSLVVRSGPAQVMDKTLTITGPGEVIVEALQAGDVVFAPASARQTIQVFSENDTPAAPRLSVFRSGSQLALKWSAPSSNFKLESAAELAGPWSELKAILDPPSNEFLHLTELDAPARFFRLKRLF